MVHKTFDEHSRVQGRVIERGRDYLPENFDMDMCRYPVWHKNEPLKWMTKAGFNRFSGVRSNHVRKIQYPGSGKAADYHVRMH